MARRFLPGQCGHLCVIVCTQQALSEHSAATCQKDQLGLRYVPRKGLLGAEGRKGEAVPISQMGREVNGGWRPA